MPQFSWVATEALTGRIIADLPDLVVSSVKATLGRYEAGSAELPLPSAPEDWQRATMPGATVLVLLSTTVDVSGNTSSVPVWGGMVTQQTLDESNTVKLTLSTVEAYFDRRFIGDEAYVQVGQNSILADLVTKYAAAGPDGGLPIRVQVIDGVGKLRDKSYKAQDDKTLYSALVDWSGIIGGPEWTVGWEYLHSPERITPVFYVGDRIGYAIPDGMGPAATFEMPGSVTGFEIVRDFSNGKGANAVLATSSGQGEVRPQSELKVLADPLRPTFEHRWTPSTSITEQGTLDDYASNAVAAMVSGTASISLSAIAEKAPQLGVDWFLGDDVGFQLGGKVPDPRRHTIFDAFIDIFTDIFGATMSVLINPFGRDSVPSVPGGFSGVARVIGWELELSNTPKITPVLVLL